MRLIILFTALIALCFTSCTSSKKTASGSKTNSAVSTANAPEDGLSFRTAVVIQETTEGAGVDAEYKWIKKNYSDYKIKGQSLTSSDRKNYDIITIELADGKELSLYFDITKFFGKF